jgi:anaerobic selenocysteine-containing dehydrogenase
MSARELIDATLRQSGWGTLEELEEHRWIDCQPSFERAHYVQGFGHRDGKFHFRPDWLKVRAPNAGPMGPHGELPALPDHWEVIETADAEHPFRLATSPARSFLNSSFAETPSSIAREGRPTVMIHPDDAAEQGIGENQEVEIGNARGSVVLHARLFDGVRRGVLISEGVWPNSAFKHGRGINTLTGADQVAPYGGAAFHDNRVWLRAAG